LVFYQSLFSLEGSLLFTILYQVHVFECRSLDSSSSIFWLDIDRIIGLNLPLACFKYAVARVATYINSHDLLAPDGNPHF
jgi:hypothetical protein